MSLALSEAWKYQGLTYPNPAVGAVVSCNGVIVSVDAHKFAGGPHAEVLAIKSAFIKLHKNKNLVDQISRLDDSSQIHDFLNLHHNNIFNDCSIYSTLEPCNHFGKTPPCALLIANLRFKRSVFGSCDVDDEANGGAKTMHASGVEVQHGLMKIECDDLLEPFVRWKNSQFIFFKYAQTLNGTIAPGKISSDKAFELVHKLRNKIDLIVIGGNSVRLDRPTLDARIVNGKAPDVMILSKQKEFDFSIPLFSVPNRKVFISDNIDIPQNYKFVMIEGGVNMLRICQSICNTFLIFVSPKCKSGISLSTLEINFDYLNSHMIGSDIAIWAKRVSNG